MRKLALAAILIGATALSGCKDDKKKDGVNLDPDASTANAADAAGGKCNPVAQTGCDAGEKCTWLNVSEDDPATPAPDAIGKTDCVPDGTAAIGEACIPGGDQLSGGTGTDDCAKGGYCEGPATGGICIPICTGTPDSCGDAAICTQYFAMFDDLGADTSVGLCNPTCNPVTQLGANGMRDPAYTDCAENEGCYVSLLVGKASCAGVPAEAVEAKQNDPCYGPDASTCYLNGCAQGYMSFTSTDADTDDSVCNAFCTPVNTYKGNAGNAPTGLAPYTCSLARVGASNQECRFMQSFYGNTDLNPPEFGACVNNAGNSFDNCTTYDPVGAIAANNAAFDAEPDAAQKPIKAGQAYCQFCGTTYNAQMEACSGEFNATCSGRGCLSLAEIDRLFAEMKPVTPMPRQSLKRQFIERNQLTPEKLQNASVPVAVK
jgi:hypothetical protein